MILDENLFEAKSNNLEKISDTIYQALTRLGYLVNADKVGYAITKRMDPSKKLVSRQDKDFDFVTDEQLDDAKDLLARANVGYFVKRLLGQPTLYIDLTNLDLDDVKIEALERSIEDRFKGWLRKLYTKKYKDKSDDEIIRAFLSFINHDATSDDTSKLKSVLARFKSDKENMLTESVADLTSIKIPGYTNTWSPIDVFTTPAPDLTRYFLMENDKYGDETQYLVVSEDLSEIYETYDDIETALRDEGILESLKESDNIVDESIVKTSKGKWVNKGKEGPHGEFTTKKRAREQQKAMFAQGYKENFYYIRDINEAQQLVDDAIKRFGRIGGSLYDELDQAGFYVDINNNVKYKNELSENIGSDIAEYQKWVDYDMKKYGKISDDTNEKIKKAGLKIVKDKYGDYEVIANEPIREDLEREFTIHYNREGFEFGGYGAVRVKATNEDEAKEKFYAEKKDDKITISSIRPTENEDIRKGIRLLETKKVSESLKDTEIDDFFDKAKKLGVKTLKDLKILLDQPEAKGDSEKEKLDSYNKEANPNDKDLTEDVEVVDKNQEEVDKKAGLENLLNDLINDENEAINGYNSAIVNFELEGKSDLTNIFRDIIKDEQNHIGNLQKVLNEINPTTIANLEQGQQEATDTLNK